MSRSNRRGYEFSDSAKNAALYRAVKQGAIPEGTPLEDIDFHHKTPIKKARRLGLPKWLVKSPQNCEPMLRREHQRFDHSDTGTDHLPLQPKLF